MLKSTKKNYQQNAHTCAYNQYANATLNVWLIKTNNNQSCYHRNCRVGLIPTQSIPDLYKKKKEASLYNKFHFPTLKANT